MPAPVLLIYVLNDFFTSLVLPSNPLPDMAARDLWPYAQYAMCPNGYVRVGPAHPSWNGSPGDAPCDSSHSVLNSSGTHRGWVMTGWDAGQGATWAP